MKLKTYDARPRKVSGKVSGSHVLMEHYSD